MNERPTICEKPKIVDAMVPWHITASAPFLEYVASEEGVPLSATFTAYFKRVISEREAWGGPHLEIVSEPEPFRPAEPNEQGEYQRIRVRFREGVTGRLCQAHSSSEVLDYRQYDFSGVVGHGLRPSETPKQYVERVDRFFLETGLSANSRFYTVQGSPWLMQVAPGRSDLHHYLLLGEETYLEVIAAGWEWELGQVVG